MKNCPESQLVSGSISDIGPFERGKNITAAEMIAGNVPVISAGLLPSGLHNKYNVKGPSITVSGSGVNAGYVSFHRDNIWAADCSYNNSSEFIHCLYLILKDIQPQITELQKGTAQPHVYPKEINPFAIVFPDKKILKELEQHFAVLFLEIDRNNKEMDVLRKVQEGILSILSN